MDATIIIRAVALLMLFAGLAFEVEGAILVVNVSGGALKGAARDGVSSFKGIPLASVKAINRDGE